MGRSDEKISRKAAELDFAGKMPFLCECDEPGCTDILRIERDEYERVRANPRRFVIARGHEAPGEELVEATDRFTIVEKRGISGGIAEETDPRRVE